MYTLGGEIGGYTYVAVGAPRFQPGERFLLFLRADRKGAFRVVGLEQGHGPTGARPVAGDWDDQ